jgi:hypothetical protein
MDIVLKEDPGRSETRRRGTAGWCAICPFAIGMDQSLTTDRFSLRAPNSKDSLGAAQGNSDTFTDISFSELTCAGNARIIEIDVVPGGAFKFSGRPTCPCPSGHAISFTLPCQFSKVPGVASNQWIARTIRCYSRCTLTSVVSNPSRSTNSLKTDSSIDGAPVSVRSNTLPVGVCR